MLLDQHRQHVWPPATILAIGHDFFQLWNTDWANAADSLFAPRAPWDDFWGFWADVLVEHPGAARFPPGTVADASTACSCC